MPHPISFVVNVERAENLVELTEAALASKDAQAEPLARKLVYIMRVLHGPDHLEVGIAQFYLAMALEEQGNLDEALAVRKQARHILLGQGVGRN